MTDPLSEVRAALAIVFGPVGVNGSIAGMDASCRLSTPFKPDVWARVSWEQIRSLADALEDARTRLATAEGDYNRIVDLPLCRLQMPDGSVPSCTEEALTLWYTEAKNAASRARTAEVATLRADLAAARQQLAEVHGEMCENGHTRHEDCTSECGCVGMGSSQMEKLERELETARDQIDQTFDAVRLAGRMADREAAAVASYHASHDQDARPEDKEIK